MADQRVNIPVTVTLRQTTLDAFQAQVQDVPLAEWLSVRCRQWLEGYKDGGIFLTPDQVKKIEEHNEKPVGNGADVVAAVGKGNSMAADGSRTFLLSLDPTWVEPIKNRAQEMGITVEQLINDTWSMALDNNWATYLEASYTPPVYFPHYRVIQTLTGKDRPTGAEIEKAISELVQVAKAAQKATAETAA
jgi:hypothetical protein